jgi:type VI secretion system protein ImpH
MSSETWTTSHPFVQFVLNRAKYFDYFQLLHLIERLESEAAPIGEQGPPGDEPVRLRPSLSLNFPSGDIAEADWSDSATDGYGHLRITTTFLGLYGSDSPLPAHFTESLLPEKEEDERVRAFIDLYHHRIFSLLYRVWKKYRYYVTFKSDGSDGISQAVRGLLGIGTPQLDKSLKLHPLRLFRYVGLLSQRPRSAAGLIGQLSDFFEGIEFDIEQCVGRWLWIQPNDRNSLGVEKCGLGQDFLLGERIFDRSGKFRVKVGPVGFDDYLRFLPTGEATADMRELVHFYCDDPLENDVEVTLRGDDVPETPLGREGPMGRLSWTTWVKSVPSKDQPVIFNAPQQGRA